MLDPRTPQVSPCDLPGLRREMANTPVPPPFWAGSNDGLPNVSDVWSLSDEFTGA